MKRVKHVDKSTAKGMIDNLYGKLFLKNKSNKFAFSICSSKEILHTLTHRSMV